MKNKLAFKVLAVILCALSLLTCFSACKKEEEAEPAVGTIEDSTFIPDWVVEPSIAAQTIQPIVRADFNENTNHYDISYANCFKIMLNGKYGIIDYNGEIVIEAEYDKIFAIRNSDDFLAVKKGEDGEDEQTYIHSDTFKTQRAYKKYNSEKYEYYWQADTAEAVFVKTEDGATSTENSDPSLPETVKGVNYQGGKYTATGKYGLFFNGVNITNMVYTGAGVYTNGLAAFESNGKWGYLDSTGKTVVPFDYDAVWGYSALGGDDTPYESSEGHITVCKNKKFGILKDDGTMLVSLIYEDATPVINGKAFAKYAGKWGVISVYDASVNESSVENTTTTTTTATDATTTTTTSTTEEETTETTSEASTTEEESTSSTTLGGTTEGAGTYVIDIDDDGYLNLRSEAGVHGEILAELKGGTVVYVARVDNGWGYTEYNGQRGWFNLKYAELR